MNHLTEYPFLSDLSTTDLVVLAEAATKVGDYRLRQVVLIELRTRSHNKQTRE